MAVFLDVLPRLGLTEAEAAFAKLKGMAAKAGDEMGLSLKTGAESGLAALEKAAVTAERTVSDQYHKMTVSALQYEAQVKKVAEVEAARGKGSAIYATAMAKQADLEGKAALATKNYGDAAVVAAASSTKLASAKDGVGKSGVSMAGVLGGVGLGSVVALGAAMGVTTEKAMNFQSSQERLVTSAGESAKNLKVVSDGLLQMAGQVGFSSGELSTGMYTVESAGFRAADGLTVMKAAAQLAKAENASLTTTTDAVTTALHDYHLGADQAAEVSSKLVTAVSQGKTTVEDFAGSLHSVQPIAASLGINIDDLYGSLAAMTASGESADQSTQNMADALRHLAKPTTEMSKNLADVGIDSRQLSNDLGKNGLAGSMQEISEAVLRHMGPSGQVLLNTFNTSKVAADAANKLFQALPPTLQKIADTAKSTGDFKDFRKQIGGLNLETRNLATQWLSAQNSADGFNHKLKAGGSDVETYTAALQGAVGDSASLNVALQLTGENAASANKNIRDLSDAHKEANGNVKGFNETEGTLKQKLDEAKAGFGAAAIEIGNSFIPIMTDVADALKTTAEFLAKHPGLLDAATHSLEVLAGAWLGFKAIGIAETVLTPIATGLAGVVAGEDAATAAAGRMKVAFSTLAPILAGVAAGYYAADKLVHADWFRDIESKNPLGHNPVSEFINRNTPSWLGGDTVDANGDVTATPQLISTPNGSDPANPQRQKGYVAPGPGDTSGIPNPNDTPNYNPATDPNGVGAGGGAGGTGKPPKGDKNDPIWITPQDSKDFKSDDKHGETGTDIITKGTDFSPQGIAKFFTALLINQALGNPVGKGLAAKRGDSQSNPMYVTNVDVDNAQKELSQAIHNNGPDSESAKKASEKLAGTRAAVGTTGGYFDPKSGSLSARSTVTDQSQDQVASAIIQEGQKRGLSRDQIIAGLNTAKLESNYGANPMSHVHQNQSGTDVEGIFQQDPGYSGNHDDPHNAAGQFFDRMISRAKPGQSAGQQAVNVQVGTYGGGYVDSQGQGGLYDRLTQGDGDSLDNYMGGGGRGLRFKSGPHLGPISPGGGAQQLSPPQTAAPSPISYSGGGGSFAPSSLIGSGAAAANNGSPNAAANGPLSVGGAASPGGAYNPGPSTTAGASTAPSTYGSGKGASTSIGATAAGALGGMPGAAQAGQLLDRTIGFGAQLGGIAAEGLMQTFLPGGGGGMGDPSKSWIGKLAGGLAGAHKSAPNSAGTTKPPVEKKDDGKDKPGGGDTHIGQQGNNINVSGDMHVSTPDANSFKGSTADQNQYPTSTR